MNIFVDPRNKHAQEFLIYSKIKDGGSRQRLPLRKIYEISHNLQTTEYTSYRTNYFHTHVFKGRKCNESIVFGQQSQQLSQVLDGHHLGQNWRFQTKYLCTRRYTSVGAIKCHVISYWLRPEGGWFPMLMKNREKNI